MDADRLLAGLGRRVRALRTERGCTLRELAARAGLSARFLVQLEAGDGNISVRKLAGLAARARHHARRAAGRPGRRAPTCP